MKLTEFKHDTNLCYHCGSHRLFQRQQKSVTLSGEPFYIVCVCVCVCVCVRIEELKHVLKEILTRSCGHRKLLFYSPKHLLNSWPQSSAEVKDHLELYLHSPTRLHGVVLIWAQWQLHLIFHLYNHLLNKCFMISGTDKRMKSQKLNGVFKALSIMLIHEYEAT